MSLNKPRFVDRPEDVEFTDRDEVFFEKEDEMPRVIGKRIEWDVSGTVDVIAHRVYVAPDPDPLNYLSPMVEILMTDTPTNAVVVPGDFPGFPLRDVMYQIGVTSVDDAGNESDMEIITAPFDFDAPDAPTNVRVVDV